MPPTASALVYLWWTRSAQSVLICMVCYCIVQFLFPSFILIEKVINPKDITTLYIRKVQPLCGRLEMIVIICQQVCVSGIYHKKLPQLHRKEYHIYLTGFNYHN